MEGHRDGHLRGAVMNTFRRAASGAAIDGNGIDHGSIQGQFIWTFLVGDVYLDGSVMDHVTSLDMVGRATYTVDLDTGATLAISFVGQYTDICAAIS
jgi:hypothetical protein